MNQELPDIQDGFRKGRGIRDQIDNIVRSQKKQESSRKMSISVSLTTLKSDCVDHNKLGEILRWEY